MDFRENLHPRRFPALQYNKHDVNAVAVEKDSVIVGHLRLPRAIFFLLLFLFAGDHMTHIIRRQMNYVRLYFYYHYAFVFNIIG